MSKINFKNLISIFLIAVISSFAASFTIQSNEESSYKCLLQLTNYTGEGAYVVVSLINPNDEYEKTLYVLGEDDEWYFDIDKWWQFQGKVRRDISAITGATISGGERSIFVLNLENEKIDKGYKIRFETAVEDQEYYTRDVEFDLTSEALRGNFEGKGFIRYVRLLPQ